MSVFRYDRRRATVTVTVAVSIAALLFAFFGEDGRLLLLLSHQLCQLRVLQVSRLFRRAVLAFDMLHERLDVESPFLEGGAR